MNENFNECLHLLLNPDREGGFVNNIHDKGGMTNLGVTRRAWEAYAGKGISEAEMRALTPAIVSPFYYSEYFVKCGADRIPVGLDHAVFDFSVNSGVGRAVKFLQAAVGVAADGVFGPATLAAARAAAPASAIRSLCDTRLAYLKGLPGWIDFGGGWGRRVGEVAAEATTMAAHPVQAPPVA